MRDFIRALLLTVTLCFCIAPQISFAATPPTPVLKACKFNGQTGVLIYQQVEPITQDGKTSQLGCYISEVLAENMNYIIILAVALIILSGVQYMVSGGSSGELTTAKQRIAGILGGVMLYFLIRFLLPVIASGLTL